MRRGAVSGSSARTTRDDGEAQRAGRRRRGGWAPGRTRRAARSPARPAPGRPAASSRSRARRARGLQVDQRRRHRGDRRAGGRPLHGARDEQHRHVRREQEQHHGDRLHGQRDRQHRASPDVVGQAADHQERGEQEDHVDREDRRQRRGREAPLRLVDDVERARDARGGQEEHDDPGHRGEEPAAADGVEGVGGCASLAAQHPRRRFYVRSTSARSGRGTAHARRGWMLARVTSPS